MTKNGYFPDNWLRPVRSTQRSLFPTPVEKFLALVEVSADEIKRWRQLGWISFDVGTIGQFDDPEIHELCFVRNIARSGLSDAQINRMLGELKKPYAYDPKRTAYSFAWGWVQVAPDKDEPGAFEVIEENLDDWMEAQAKEGNLDRLRDLHLRAYDLITASKKADKGGDEKGAET